MLEKAELFNKWRDKKASNEQHYLEAALFVDQYMGSVKALDVVKKDFASRTSSQYKAFKSNDYCTTGMVLNCILDLDSYLEKIPLTNSVERELILQVKNNLIELYEAPLQDISGKTTRLFTHIQNLLNMDSDAIFNKKQALKQWFNVYIAFQVLTISIKHFNGFQLVTVRALINLDFVKKKLADQLVQIELKIHEINGLLASSENNHPLLPTNRTQDFFHERCLSIWQQKGYEPLAAYLLEVIAHIDSLIEKQNQKEQLLIRIQNLIEFQEHCAANDKKILGWLFYSELIKTGSEGYETVMSYGSTEAKTRLLEGANQLNLPAPSQSLFVKFVYSLFRFHAYLNPIGSSRLIKMPLELYCQRSLGALIAETLLSLNQESEAIDSAIEQIIESLSQGNDEVRFFLSTESRNHLIASNCANKAMLHTLNSFIKISHSLEAVSLCLTVNKQARMILEEFIRLHDGLLVRFSNFMAQFWSLFKSDTAVLIDRAQTMNAQLEAFELTYKRELLEELDKIDVNLEIGRRLKEIVQGKIEPIINRPLSFNKVGNKEEIRYLIYQLNKMFASSGTAELNGVHEVIEEFLVSDILKSP